VLKVLVSRKIALLPSFRQIVIFVLSNVMASCGKQSSEVEGPIYSTESPSLNDIHPERDVGGEHAPSNEGRRQKPGRPFRSSGKDFQFRSVPSTLRPRTTSRTVGILGLSRHGKTDRKRAADTD
jgi:hypothetical protein